jgi:hypothetical protein
MSFQRTELTGLNFLSLSLLVLICCSCVSNQPDQTYLPEGDFKQRLQSQTIEGVTVTTGVPSASESKELFGSTLYKNGVQPVWLEITNDTDKDLSFLPVGLDPSYFTPTETRSINSKIGQMRGNSPLLLSELLNAGMPMSIPAHGSSSGFMFTRLDEGTKTFNVDIVGDNRFDTFTFFVPVPGLRADHYNVDWAGLYPQEEIKEVNAQQLISLLEEQVCCTTDKKSKGSGDPVNLVIIGDLREVYVAFIRAGWDETETVTSGTAWKTMKSFIGGGEYRYSPVSGLYVFGRPQDVAFQKARENIHERNHLRLWLSPYRLEGELVWLGQISRDIGVRWTTKTITTHKIDPNVDETREYLLEDLAYAQALEKFAYVGGVGEVSYDQPRGNLTGDPWFSDGYRLVLWVSSVPVDFDELQYVPWRSPLERKFSH